MMEAQAIRRFAFKSNQQGLKFINPGEGALTDEAMLVHTWVEMPFPPAFDRFAVAFIFGNIGLDPTIPQQLPRCTRIKAAIHIEERTAIRKITAFHIPKDVLELLIKHIAIIMVARNDPGGRNDGAITISYGQDIAGLCFLASLVSDFFAPFFAALWLPSRFSSDKFNSPRMEIMLASKRRWRLPSLLHLRK